MFKKIVPITKENHSDMKIKELTDFNFAKEINVASIMVHEFSKAASTYPIVFIEDKEKDQFRAVVLLGLEAGENLFVKNGKWSASYVPAIIRRYPFALARTGDDNRFTICIDEDCELLNKKQGEPLFDKEGDSSKLIEKVKQYLSELQQMEQFTDKFAKFLKENNMFTPLNMKVRFKDEIKSINGAYVVNEDRLRTLSDEKYLEFRKNQYIPAIYAHLGSLSQIERLLAFKDNINIDDADNTLENRFEKTVEEK
jgi:hypothetical protein